jgi:hypothetical protein
MRSLAACLLLAVSLGAHAQERRYAVLSLLSDQLTIITRDMATGSHIDRNHREVLAIPGNLLDRDMVATLDDALAGKASRPPVLLFTRDAKIFARQAELLDASAGTAALLEAVRPVLANVDATHLVLAAKYRHDARLQIEDGYVGSGLLEGLGFYVDRSYEPRRMGNIGVAPGYLSAFAYFKLALIDLASGRIVKEVPVFASESRVGGDSETGHPWDAMTPADKVAALERLMKAEAPRAVGLLLAP